jgi:hypothetical protein
VIVEAKVWEGDPANRAFEQLAERSSLHRGALGILVCRTAGTVAGRSALVATEPLISTKLRARSGFPIPTGWCQPRTTRTLRVPLTKSKLTVGSALDPSEEPLPEREVEDDRGDNRDQGRGHH